MKIFEKFFKGRKGKEAGSATEEIAPSSEQEGLEIVPEQDGEFGDSQQVQKSREAAELEEAKQLEQVRKELGLRVEMRKHLTVIEDAYQRRGKSAHLNRMVPGFDSLRFSSPESQKTLNLLQGNGIEKGRIVEIDSSGSSAIMEADREFLLQNIIGDAVLVLRGERGNVVFRLSPGDDPDRLGYGQTEGGGFQGQDNRHDSVKRIAEIAREAGVDIGAIQSGTFVGQSTIKNPESLRDFAQILDGELESVNVTVEQVPAEEDSLLAYYSPVRGDGNELTVMGSQGGQDDPAKRGSSISIPI